MPKKNIDVESVSGRFSTSTIDAVVSASANHRCRPASRVFHQTNGTATRSETARATAVRPLKKLSDSVWRCRVPTTIVSRNAPADQANDFRCTPMTNIAEIRP